MNNQPIGVLDSGVGGLSIWREIVKLLPSETTIYLADSLNCPYGVKNPEEIYVLTKKLVDFLLAKKVKLIVLACNTITVNCLSRLREEYPEVPIIGTVPVIKTAASISKNKKIGVFSTESTAQSEYQQSLIREFANGCDVINIGTNRLVPFIEKGIIDGEVVRNVLTETLRPFQEKEIDILALGCSHYPFVKEAIGDILGENISILDSGEAIARQVERVLSQEKKKANEAHGHNEFYTTGNEQVLKEFLSRVLLYDTIPHHVSLAG